MIQKELDLKASLNVVDEKIETEPLEAIDHAANIMLVDMEALREGADMAESLIPNEMWPFVPYGKMLRL